MVMTEVVYSSLHPACLLNELIRNYDSLPGAFWQSTASPPARLTWEPLPSESAFARAAREIRHLLRLESQAKSTAEEDLFGSRRGSQSKKQMPGGARASCATASFHTT
jgi:hypothetical protein